MSCSVGSGSTVQTEQHRRTDIPMIARLNDEQIWWTAEDNRMEYQALMDLWEEKLWLMWNLHGPPAEGFLLLLPN
ncbi:hypothetical protein IHE44_0008338 [Lamprotornis superbus]|uniref:Uncharacterized protein n=1 Tax=Lamprotornis superbus TaxID=245042 RepID=A0A835NK63_9PASS|nr:hypothetical protein IHE44_0008338 [Lamprotornis superbus]